MKNILIKLIQSNLHILGISEFSDDPDEYSLIKLYSRSCSNSNIVVAILNNTIKETIAISKIPRNPLDTQIIESEFNTLSTLKARILEEKIIRKIPIETIVDRIGNESFLIQRYKHGQKLIKYLNSMSYIEKIFPKVFTWAFDFYECEPKRVISLDEIKQILFAIISKFKTLYASVYNTIDDSVITYIQKFENSINSIGIDKITLISQHNDFNAHNIIINCENNDFNDFYVLDWEGFKRFELPIFDINHFFFSSGNMLPRKRNIDNFDRYVLNRGPYSELYRRTIKAFERYGYISYDEFIKLTPIYFINMCIVVADDHREEKHTAKVWLSRLQKFVAHFNL